MACGFSGSELPRVAKHRDFLDMFISRAHLGVANGAILVPVGLGTSSNRGMSV